MTASDDKQDPNSKSDAAPKKRGPGRPRKTPAEKTTGSTSSKKATAKKPTAKRSVPKKASTRKVTAEKPKSTTSDQKSSKNQRPTEKPKGKATPIETDIEKPAGGISSGSSEAGSSEAGSSEAGSSEAGSDNATPATENKTLPKQKEAPKKIAMARNSEETTKMNNSDTKSNKESFYGDGTHDTAEELWGEKGKRLLYMILFGVIAWWTMGITLALAAAHYVVIIITDAPNKKLGDFIASLGTYIKENIDYLSMQTDERPFPLGKDFPSSPED